MNKGDVMNNFKNQKFCQSCAMPIDDELFGTNTSDRSMDEMMNFCIDKMTEIHPEIDKSEASSMMREIFPKLKRWQND